MFTNASCYIVGTSYPNSAHETNYLKMSSFPSDISKPFILSACLVGKCNVYGPCGFSLLGLIQFASEMLPSKGNTA